MTVFKSKKKGLGVEIPFFLIIIPVVVFLAMFIAWTMGFSKSVSTLHLMLVERNVSNRLFWFNFQPEVDGQPTLLQFDEMLGIYTYEKGLVCNTECQTISIKYDGREGDVNLQNILEKLIVQTRDCDPIFYNVEAAGPVVHGISYFLSIPASLLGCTGNKYLYNETILTPTPDFENHPATLWTLLHKLIEEDVNVELAEFSIP